MSPLEKFKQSVWRIIYPVFPKLEKTFLRFHEKERQRYHIGWLAPEKTLADLKIHLSKNWGFGNHFVAWEDSDQVLSWRKLASFREQYHLRVYRDGEIRGHYELTPEGAPLAHFEEKGETDKREDFLKFLDGFIVSTQYPREVAPDTTVPVPDSEVTYQDPNQEK